MGVILVVHEASKLGFRNGDPDWCNLGQDQPEIGPVRGAPPRIMKIGLEPDAHGPVGGTDAPREAVADRYNRLYRSNRRSRYTGANVAIAAGGRLPRRPARGYDG